MEEEVKRVMLQIIPLLRDNSTATFTTELLSHLSESLLRATNNIFDSDQVNS